MAPVGPHGNWSLKLSRSATAKAATSRCPHGFEAWRGTGRVYCVRAVSTPVTWEQARDACAPYSLGTAVTQEHMDAIAGAVTSDVLGFWYAAGQREPLERCRYQH